MVDSQTFHIFDNATDKQIEVLDLAASGMTSKHIARELGIVPRAVDQRIDVVRGKLGGMPRVDVLRHFRAWRATCGQATCDPSPLPKTQPDPPSNTSQPEPEIVFRDTVVLDGRASWERHGDWLRPGGQPSDLRPWQKLLAVFVVAFALLVSFALIVTTAEGIGTLAASLG